MLEQDPAKINVELVHFEKYARSCMPGTEGTFDNAFVVTWLWRGRRTIVTAPFGWGGVVTVHHKRRYALDVDVRGSGREDWPSCVIKSRRGGRERPRGGREANFPFAQVWSCRSSFPRRSCTHVRIQTYRHAQYIPTQYNSTVLYLQSASRECYRVMYRVYVRVRFVLTNECVGVGCGAGVDGWLVLPSVVSRVVVVGLPPVLRLSRLVLVCLPPWVVWCRVHA